MADATKITDESKKDSTTDVANASNEPRPETVPEGNPRTDPDVIAHQSLVGSGHWGRDEAAKILRYLHDAGIELVHHPRP